jgi:formate-dependent nitrite reductase cytochrome c552 subunit
VASWADKPGHTACATCHEREAKGFLEGKHGMRLAQKLTPMTPAMARIPMRADARDAALGCTTCHGAHAFDTKRAAVEACEGCHADNHTKAFRASRHFALWQAELTGTAPPSSGVSCATCHLPRELHKSEGGETVAAQHNQNLNLRPNEKMVRSVCLACHGLGFALDALADPHLIASNFKGRPARKVESIAWVKRRLEMMATKAKERGRP